MISDDIQFLLTKYYPGDQIKKNERGGACGTHGRRGSGWGNLKRLFARFDVNGRIILK
jgi:hypothetical protein